MARAVRDNLAVNRRVPMGMSIGTSLAAIGLLAAPAFAWSAETPEAARAAKGKITYGRYCVACHGAAGRGDGSLAGDLRVPVPDLTTLATRSGGTFPAGRVGAIIAGGEVVRGHGTNDMPAWGDAFKKTQGTDEKTVQAAVRNLTAYLKSLQQPAQ
jgi:mono/diheme cytochrome c family protein